MKNLLVLFFVFVSVMAFGQETEDKLEFGSTDKTSKQPKYSTKNKEAKTTKIHTIITKDNKKVLEGNKCFLDFTLEMGFQYELSTRGRKEYEKGFARLLHNIATKSLLTVKKGPFWAVKVRKKRKECILLMHDYMG